jgi:mono/diheme cytochrome c family protein
MERHRVTKAVLAALGACVLLGTYATRGVAEDPQARHWPHPKPSSFDFWAPDWMVRELWGPGRMSKGMMARMLRHSAYMNYGVPKDYEGVRGPETVTPDMVAAGRAVYAENCATCHGKDGMGDGDGAKALSPSPALLAFMIRRPITVDEYLLWSISDGGKAFDTDMPAFKDKLSREAIWNVVAYMRAGFPE